MHEAFRKMYPVAKMSKVHMRGITQIAFAGTSGNIDLKNIDDDIVHIILSNAGSVAVNVLNIAVGQMVIAEQLSASVSCAVTFTGCSMNSSGHDTATMDAADESLAVIKLNDINGDKLYIIQNNGGVVTS